MNVEVEIIQEVKTTYLVQGVRSLEGGERAALAHHDLGEKRKNVKQLEINDEVSYVLWSTPVIVRNGEIIRDE